MEKDAVRQQWLEFTRARLREGVGRSLSILSVLSEVGIEKQIHK
jgi:hypothetical protein